MYRTGAVVKFTDECPWAKEQGFTHGIVIGYMDPSDAGAVQSQPDGPTHKDCVVAVIVAEYMKGLGFQTKTYFVQEKMVELAAVDTVIEWTEHAASSFEEMVAEVGVVPPKKEAN